MDWQSIRFPEIRERAEGKESSMTIHPKQGKTHGLITRIPNFEDN